MKTDFLNGDLLDGRKTKMLDKRIFKKTGEELQQYLQAMRKHGVKKNKKGKGSYSRKKKHKKENE